MNEVKEKKKIGLTTRIFIALIAGAIVGIALNMFAADVDFVQNVLVNGIFYVVGQGFIRLMQMLVVPLVFCSLICGATAIGDSKTLGKVGVKIIGFYIFTTMMAVARCAWHRSSDQAGHGSGYVADPKPPKSLLLRIRSALRKPC